MEMEAQLHRTTHHEEDPHKNAALHPSGGHNHEGEKKSVLKKVKDKAKKIKDTIKKHGQHEHDHEYRHDQVSEEDDDDDDDEETVIHSDVHGAPAPITESAFISGTNLPKQTAVNLEKVYNPGMRNEVYPDVGDRVGVNQTRNSGPGPVELSDELKNPHLEAAGPKVRSGLMDDLAEDPHPPHHTLPLSSYQTKGPDPTTARGGREADMKNIEVYSGVGDRVGVTKTQTPGPSPVELPHELKNPCSEAVSGPKVKIGPLEDLVEGPHSPNNTLPISNYQTKVADPTPQGGREADFAPLVQHLDDLSIRDKFESKPEQRSYTGSHDQFAPQSTPINDQLDPEPNQEMPKAFDADEKQSMPRDTIAGKISLATSAITDKAVSAKNVVGSKLGYGSQDTCGKAPSESLIDYASGDSVVNPEPNREMPKGFDTNETESMPRDTIAGKISLATSVITDKAVSAKNVVASKLGYGSQDTCEKAPSESLTEDASGDGVVKDSDKGVSVKGYLIEKFSPRDEDKALSEAITDSMQKKKEGMYVAAHGESPGGGVVDRVKGTVSSWLGMSSGMNTAQHEYGGPGGEERRGIEEVDQSLKTSDK